MKYPIQKNAIILRMKFLLSFLFLFTILFQNAYTQGWERAYDKGEYELGFALQPTLDGGYLFAGEDDEFMYFIRTDASGNIIWEQSYGIEDTFDRVFDLVPASDGGYVAAGSRQHFMGDWEGLIMKIDENGDSLWMYNYGTSNRDEFKGLSSTADGGYIMVGNTYPFDNDSTDIFIVKTDVDGQEEWRKIYGWQEKDKAYNVVQAADGGYLIVGSHNQDPSSESNMMLLKISATGDSLWTKTYGSTTDFDEGLNIIETPDGGYMLIGEHNVSGMSGQMMMAKTDADGNELWWTSHGTSWFEEPYDVANTSDGGFIISGIQFEPQNDDAQLVLLKTAENGDSTWMKTFGGIGHDEGNSVAETTDGGYISLGYTRSFNNGDPDFYVVKTDGTGTSLSNFIQGNIFHDLDVDCLPTGNEEGLQGWYVKADADLPRYGTTDSLGNYSILTDTGTYEVSLVLQNLYWESCTPGTSVTFSDFHDTTTVDFPVQNVHDCPLIRVDISTPFLRRCFDNIYRVTYCNEGTVTAENATIEIVFDEYLEVNSSTLMWSSNVDSLYIFDIGNLEVGECGSFQINVTVSCEAALGQTHCVEAHAFPDTLCLPPNVNWDGSSIRVEGTCENDSIQFRIINDGLDMQNQGSFIVIEDHVLGLTGSYQLLAGHEKTVSIEATGKTFRMEALQSPFHPVENTPSAMVEKCGEDPYSFGVVTQFPEDDTAPFISTDCQQNIGSYDPNDKNAFPGGITEQHCIHPDTEIEYHIRFQNTGTDTAFRVVVRDTLSEFLNVESLRPGASSHEYDFKLLENNIAQFTFDNIMLPDSNVNEPASHGFFKFRIAQQSNNPIGTLIENDAAIFFDFNEPIITNTVFHTVDTMCLISIIFEKEFELFEKVKVFPNPFRTQTTFEIQRPDFQEGTFSIYDITGILLFEKEIHGNTFEFTNPNLQEGLYVFKILDKKGRTGVGKLIVQ